MTTPRCALCGGNDKFWKETSYASGFWCPDCNGWTGDICETCHQPDGRHWTVPHVAVRTPR